MPHVKDIHTHLERAGAVFLQFPLQRPTDDNPNPPTAAVAESVGALEAEYAAIRKGAALIDEPHTGLAIATGTERLDFLNSMLTQQLVQRNNDGNDLHPYRSTDSFWLNRKGRIDADLRVINQPDRTLLLTDAIAAPAAATNLNNYIFSEDAQVQDHTAHTHTLSIHGPAAIKLIAHLASKDPDHPEAPEVPSLTPNTNTAAHIAGHPVTIDRNDRTADPGLTIICSHEHAADIFNDIAKHARTDHGHNNPADTNQFRLRLAGWGAFNIARLEAGTPIFRIDFSTNNLPAETGLLSSRVNFTKGCYLGQEVVARMDALGHPKQTLAPLKAETPHQGLPLEAAPLFSDPSDTKPVGAITSSTASPLLGGTPIALAAVKWGHHTPGTTLHTTTDAGPTTLTVHNAPAFIQRTTHAT